MGEWFLSRRDSTIVARHEVPGIIRKIARPSGTIEPIQCERLAAPRPGQVVPNRERPEAGVLLLDLSSIVSSFYGLLPPLLSNESSIIIKRLKLIRPVKIIKLY
jgi:hypothetical protein